MTGNGLGHILPAGFGFSLKNLRVLSCFIRGFELGFLESQLKFVDLRDLDVKRAPNFSNCKSCSKTTVLFGAKSGF